MKRLTKMAVGGMPCLLIALFAVAVVSGGAAADLPRAAHYLTHAALLVAALVFAISGIALLVKTVIAVIDR